MNKGTALVCAFLSFLAGMGLMWGIAQSQGISMGPEVAATAGASDESSPLPVYADDPQWGSATAPVTIIEISDFASNYIFYENPH